MLKCWIVQISISLQTFACREHILQIVFRAIVHAPLERGSGEHIQLAYVFSSMTMYTSVSENIQGDIGRDGSVPFLYREKNYIKV